MNFTKIKKETITYLKESKSYIYFATLSFIFFIIVGIVFSSKLGFLDEIIKNLVSKVSYLEGLDVAKFIFINNASAALVAIFGGLILGVIPIMNLISNGVVIGYVFARVTKEIGIFEIWKILPHGVFELPAIFISLGLGIRLGMFVFSKNPYQTLKERLYYSIWVFLLVIVPLLALAACIEGMLIDIFE